MRTGRVAWSFPDGFNVGTYLPGRLVLTGGLRDRVVDPATGKTSREVEPLGEVLATAPGGAWLLTLQGGRTWLWSTETWIRQPTTLRLWPRAGAALSADGKLAFYAESDQLVIHRFADGRSLRRALPELDFDITDEGIFDPSQPASGAVLVRRGPDVVRSPMGPLTLLAESHGHRGLFADFIAGKPVGLDAGAPRAPSKIQRTTRSPRAHPDAPSKGVSTVACDHAAACSTTVTSDRATAL